MRKPTEPFTPPGPGVWERESTHITRPVSRAMAALFPAAASEGFRSGMKRYSLLLEGLEFAVVNGFVYVCPRPVGAPKNAKGPPPKLIFKLLSKLHPEIRRRIHDLKDVFASRRWREDVDRWDREWKPAIAKENRELQSVDVRSLSDEQLAKHLERCFDAASRGVSQQHALNGTAMLPLGDFLVHVRDWTGLAPADVLPLFRGSSRVSRGAAEELEALRAVLDPAAVEGDDPRAIIAALTSRDDQVGAAMRRYVDAVGIRVATGYDFADLTLAEMPDVLVGTIRAALKPSGESANDVVQREQAIRERVPAEHRAEFDALLAEARHTYRMRDERAYLNDAWSTGVARRAMLVAGERLAARGRIHERDHVFDLAPDELLSMLRGGSGPSPDDVTEWYVWRTTHSMDDAPPFLGGTPSGSPPADWLPPHAARAARAVDICMAEMFAARTQQESASRLSGYGASPGSITGTARLVIHPQDMARVQKGDLLVTRSTAPSYNALLPLLAGIVTDRGGTLSHAAVVAREYGIPAVVGCGNATEKIRDGMTIRIDGAAGTVELVA